MIHFSKVHESDSFGGRDWTIYYSHNNEPVGSIKKTVTSTSTFYTIEAMDTVLTEREHVFRFNYSDGTEGVHFVRLEDSYRTLRIAKAKAREVFNKDRDFLIYVLTNQMTHKITRRVNRAWSK